jgi:hypothetical protein
MIQFTKTLLVHNREHPVHLLLFRAPQLCTPREHAHCKALPFSERYIVPPTCLMRNVGFQVRQGFRQTWLMNAVYISLEYSPVRVTPECVWQVVVVIIILLKGALAPTAVVTEVYKLSGLKQPKCIVSWVWRLGVWDQVVFRTLLSLEALGENQTCLLLVCGISCSIAGTPWLSLACNGFIIMWPSP